MFTGLVEEVGTIAALTPQGDGARVRLVAGAVRRDLAVGDSVAVDGACLTAVALTDDGLEVDAVAETLRRTTLGDRAPGDRVNLERALRVGDRLGGHLVQGHVDGTGEVTAVRPEGGGRLLRVRVPHELLRYVVEKGSLAIDGVSLTVAARHADGCSVALIPHTLAATTLGEAAAGRRVNLEVDLMAKYVESLAGAYLAREGSR
jgi:riboflavin synthase